MKHEQSRFVSVFKTGILPLQIRWLSWQVHHLWLGGTRWTCDCMEIAGSIPAAALSSATLNKSSHTLSSASEVMTLWRYINQVKNKRKTKKVLTCGRLSWPALWSTFGRSIKSKSMIEVIGSQLTTPDIQVVDNFGLDAIILFIKCTKFNQSTSRKNSWNCCH